MLNKLNSKYMIAFDWLLAISVIFYAIYKINIDGYTFGTIALLFSGLIGCVFAHYRPVNILKHSIKKSIVKRS
jgi:hypothetical protein